MSLARSSLLFVLLVVALYLASGCAGMAGASRLTAGAMAGSQTPITRLDLKGTIGAFSFTGWGVVPAARDGHYPIRIHSLTDIDALVISTCAREQVFEDALTVSPVAKWLERKKTLSFEYIPTPLETGGGCLLRVSTFNRNTSEANQSAIFDFQTQDAKLPGSVICNGEVIPAPFGASFCETAAGLLHRVMFAIPVIPATDTVIEACKVEQMPSPDKTKYDIKTPEGLCSYRYSELNPPYRQHRHNSRGYTKIKIRGT